MKKDWLLLATGIALIGISGFRTSGLDRYTASVIPLTKTQSIQPTLNFKNWGLYNSQADSHIHVRDAWKLSEGSRDVVVAVIDTGIDANHVDLSRNLWRDPKNPTTYGWDFTNNTSNPKDDHGHGTHVSGIIGAITNPETGVSGVAKKVSIMAVKYYSESAPGSVNLINTIKALNYAIDHNAQVINYSGGGPEFSEGEYLAMKRAESKGILVVCAAGNERQDTDKRENFYYPAAYGLSNIISVAATDIRNKLITSSNWGKSKVDVAAPGDSIYSTLPGGKHGMMTGTSQATAFVTGLAALMIAKNPSLTPSQIKTAIKGSVDKLPTLLGKVASGGRVNAYAALSQLQPKAPVVRLKPVKSLAYKSVKRKTAAEPVIIQ
ncbi:MAG: S8 family serine peptidase [Xanthomonadaceae bacterium]|nr:S8 family serine peptidase [Xanthomonadaceae bacterium]